MGEVKRFSLTAAAQGLCYSVGALIVDPEGGTLVPYSDYARLEAENRELRERAERAERALSACFSLEEEGIGECPIECPDLGDGQTRIEQCIDCLLKREQALGGGGKG